MTSSQEREDEAIDACLRGEIAGLAHLYERYRLRVFRTCSRLLGDPASAEDATSEIFLRVYDRISSFSRKSAFSTWLYRLVVNHCLNLLDRMERRVVVQVGEVLNGIDSDGGPLRSASWIQSRAASPEETLAQRQMQERIVHLLMKLSPEHRSILVLREIEDLSYGEIAGALEIPVGTVMSRLARAREALRQLWSDEIPRSTVARGPSSIRSRIADAIATAAARVKRASPEENTDSSSARQPGREVSG